jgi:hypothetical protein
LRGGHSVRLPAHKRRRDFEDRFPIPLKELCRTPLGPDDFPKDTLGFVRAVDRVTGHLGPDSVPLADNKSLVHGVVQVRSGAMAFLISADPVAGPAGEWNDHQARTYENGIPAVPIQLAVPHPFAVQVVGHMAGHVHHKSPPDAGEAAAM